ncbi:MAG: DNA recombination protein RmuC [Candidatus Anstonellales archaeon]
MEVLLFLILILVLIIAYLLTQKINNLNAENSLQRKDIEEIKSSLKSLYEINNSYYSTLNQQLNSINRYLGSIQGKGKLGENILEEQLNSLIKVNWVQKKVNLGNNKIVEFALVLNDEKYLPIDSKMIYDLNDFEKVKNLLNEGSEGLKINKNDLIRRVKFKIDEVEKYKSLPRSCNHVILALPDEIYNIVINDVFAEANAKNIIITAYSNLISTCYIFQLYYKQLSIQDYSNLIEKIQELEQVVLLVNDKSNTIANAIKIIENANSEVQQKIRNTKIRKMND